MEVKTVIEVLEKMLAILKHYENYTVHEMLGDLSARISSGHPAKQQTGKQAGNNQDYTDAIAKIKEMNQEEARRFLSQLKKNELIGIGQQMNIKLHAKDTKKMIIDSIIHHYSFIQLHAQMANRKHHTEMAMFINHNND
ncbi:hypothetical protein [Geobacillus jurassicus]|uniref:Uncharacterized protein n=1 Tax=Geobacillus jurassicus TaxID=235932 RepID=A0ABV6GVP3_9BACL|nr:hypothetical protein [Geobacillus jurassicus]